MAAVLKRKLSAKTQEAKTARCPPPPDKTDRWLMRKSPNPVCGTKEAERGHRCTDCRIGIRLVLNRVRAFFVMHGTTTTHWCAEKTLGASKFVNVFRAVAGANASIYVRSLLNIHRQVWAVPNPGMESVQIVEFVNGKREVDLSWKAWPRETCALGVKLLRVLSFFQSQQNLLLLDPMSTFGPTSRGRPLVQGFVLFAMKPLVIHHQTSHTAQVERNLQLAHEVAHRSRLRGKTRTAHVRNSQFCKLVMWMGRDGAPDGRHTSALAASCVIRWNCEQHPEHACTQCGRVTKKTLCVTTTEVPSHSCGAGCKNPHCSSARRNVKWFHQKRRGTAQNFSGVPSYFCWMFFSRVPNVSQGCVSRDWMPPFEQRKDCPFVGCLYLLITLCVRRKLEVTSPAVYLPRRRAMIARKTAF